MIGVFVCSITQDVQCDKVSILLSGYSNNDTKLPESIMIVTIKFLQRHK